MRDIRDVEKFVDYEICDNCKMEAVEKVKFEKRKEERKTKEEKDWDSFVLSRY
jgi:hypothetical protein